MKHPDLSPSDINVKSVPPDIYTREYYLTEVAGYKEFLGGTGQIQFRDQNIFKAIGLQRGHFLLDIGCGRGEILLHSMKAGVMAVGIDYSSDAINLAAETIRCGEDASREYQAAALSRTNSKWLPFMDNSFDRIILVDVVEHLYPSEVYQTLLEAYRVLKPDGLLLIHTTPNQWYADFGYGLTCFLYAGVRLKLMDMLRLLKNLIISNGSDWCIPRSALQRSMHVNELSPVGLYKAITSAGFNAQLFFLPVCESGNWLKRSGRRILQCTAPFSYLLASELYAYGRKQRLDNS